MLCVYYIILTHITLLIRPLGRVLCRWEHFPPKTVHKFLDDIYAKSFMKL